MRARPAGTANAAASGGGALTITGADAPKLGLYVHFPWCVKKCPYCDFNSHPLTGGLQEDAYIRALEREFQARAGTREPGSVQQFDSAFFGGGTPSLFSAAALSKLLGQFRPFLRDAAEITMEANPGATERDDLGAYREAGINRLSIGAQSFSQDQLKRLGRIHGPDEVTACVEAARHGGFDNINLDLMYGLPSQTPKEAIADLEAAIALAPDHLSWYQLTIEPKTEFARRPPPGMPDEAVIAAMESAGRALLADAGFARYEISAYAKAGAACRHNLVYWTFGDYLGLGAGAHGKLGPSAPPLIEKPGAATAATPAPSHRADDPPVMRPDTPPDTSSRGNTPCRPLSSAGPRIDTLPEGAGNLRGPTLRTHNPRQPRLYMQDPCNTETVPVHRTELPGEFMMNALRLVGGVDRCLFEARTSLPWSTVEPAWERATRLGLTEADRIAATPHGLQHLDTLIQYFL